MEFGDKWVLIVLENEFKLCNEVNLIVWRNDFNLCARASENS